MTAVSDRLAERASRWVAARTTRRGLLAGAGKAAIIAVGGSGVAALWAQRAGARVCGQSGISPLCPTYDCAGEGFVWGWCWYASPGCCANGGLKKICDCCKTGFANVHGYCPDGANVYCAAESCLEDPRVQAVPVDWTDRTDATGVGLRFSQYRSLAPGVVVGYAPDPLWPAVAVAVATELGWPLLFSGPGVAEELGRLGTTRVIGVGPVAEATEWITSATDVAVASVEVGAWLLGRTGGSNVVLVGADEPAVVTAAASAALAVSRRAPLVVGPDALAALQLAIGRNLEATPGPLAGELGGAALELAQRAFIARHGKVRLGVFALGASGASIVSGGGVALGVGIDTGVVAPAVRDWLIATRAEFSAVDIVGLPIPMVKEIQSAVNGYDFHQLVGLSGQGLPVYPQPDDERVLGKVRVAGPLPSSTTTKAKASTASKAPQYLTPVPVTTQPRPTTTIDPSLPTTTSAPVLVPASPSVPVPGPAPASPSNATAVPVRALSKKSSVAPKPK